MGVFSDDDRGASCTVRLNIEKAVEIKKDVLIEALCMLKKQLTR